MPYVNIHTHRPTGVDIEPSSIGLHPWDAGKEPFNADDFIVRAAAVQAVGEIGLDFLRGGNRKQQEDVLRLQLKAAEMLCKPVILHCVKAFEPMIKIVKEYRLPAVVFHGFTGSPQQAARAVGEGYFLSFGERVIRSPKATESRRMTPDENLFLETDDAELGIADIYSFAAGVRGTTVETLQDVILKNYNKIFSKE